MLIDLELVDSVRDLLVGRKVWVPDHSYGMTLTEPG